MLLVFMATLYKLIQSNVVACDVQDEFRFHCMIYISIYIGGGVNGKAFLLTVIFTKTSTLGQLKLNTAVCLFKYHTKCLGYARVS